MGRNRFRIGKAEKKRKRRKQGYGQSKWGRSGDVYDGYDPGPDIALTGLLWLGITMARKGRTRRQNEKEDRQSREEEETRKEAAPIS